MAETRTPIISFKNFSFQYRAQKQPTLHDINLDIYPGERVLIAGPSGSGKSTLAKHFNSILLPTGGRVYVDGMDTADEELLLAIRRTVGMVFQNPDNQIVANVVEEDVAFAPENLGVSSREIRQRVDDALAAVGMGEFARHAPHLLSGGQKQRIAIAGVLAMEPECIVLDEATAMLDPAGRADVLATVRKLNREQGMPVIWITHFMEEAAVADRVVVLDKGKIALDGTPAEVFSQVQKGKALGLDVFPAESAEEAKRTLHALAKENYAVVYLTEGYAAHMEAELERYKDALTPAIILIPGKVGSLGIGMANVMRAVERAVGADIT